MRREEAEACRREDGIRAIVALQKVAGIEEPRDRAERAWDAMTTHQRTWTLFVYKKLICEGGRQ